jgi:hypothetical protein
MDGVKNTGNFVEDDKDVNANTVLFKDINSKAEQVDVKIKDAVTFDKAVNTETGLNTDSVAAAMNTDVIVNKDVCVNTHIVEHSDIGLNSETIVTRDLGVNTELKENTEVATNTTATNKEESTNTTMYGNNDVGVNTEALGYPVIGVKTDENLNSDIGLNSEAIALVDAKVNTDACLNIEKSVNTEVNTSCEVGVNTEDFVLGMEKILKTADDHNVEEMLCFEDDGQVIISWTCILLILVKDTFLCLCCCVHFRM